MRREFVEEAGDQAVDHLRMRSDVVDEGFDEVVDDDLRQGKTLEGKGSERGLAAFDEVVLDATLDAFVHLTNREAFGRRAH